MAGCSTAGKKNSKVDLLTYEERKLACPEQEQLAPAEKKVHACRRRATHRFNDQNETEHNRLKFTWSAISPFTR
jgi:hypothetical protein